ncbi:cilia- and flagella-associated protein 251-like [Capsicum annuum]|uniref:cilia- and flagella-associated protein 251-like n=1 Tax=Capsicum annuum TaxID=4072 RepID=UPI001FB10567|nr:cilia- and flagella-associated protein 251-like [Capsicum annuum]
MDYMVMFKSYTDEVKNNVLDGLNKDLQGVNILTSNEDSDDDGDLDSNSIGVRVSDDVSPSTSKDVEGTSVDGDLHKCVAMLKEEKANKEATGEEKEETEEEKEAEEEAVVAGEDKKEVEEEKKAEEEATVVGERKEEAKEKKEQGEKEEAATDVEKKEMKLKMERKKQQTKKKENRKMKKKQTKKMWSWISLMKSTMDCSQSEEEKAWEEKIID